jgi:ribonuclease BN (tRNA processing enzyme)
MHRPYFPTGAWSGLPARIQYNNLKKHFRIGRIKVSMIANNHPNYTVGFRFTERGRSFAFLTDNELFAQRGKTTYKQFVTFVRGVDLLIHDAQYTDDIYKMRLGWGHSTYNQVMNLARDARVKRVLFTHHDPASTDGYIDRIVKTVKRQFPGLRVEAAAEGRTIILK